jgi:thioredoxin 1
MNEITNSEFDATKHNVAIVDFWAPWCVPCTIMMPTFRKVSEQFTDFAFYKANVDDNRDLTKQHEITGIPAIVIFKNGQVHTKLTGIQTETQLREVLQKIV